MYRALVSLHRVLGLGLAAFLCIAGLTGAVIGWNHELDVWLNPELFERRAQLDAPALHPLELADRLERADPRLYVSYLPLALEPGRSAGLFVQPRIDPATQRPYELDFDEVALDPADGTILGRRMWGRFGFDRAHLMPFLYRLHYSLHLPELGGVDSGIMLMGVCALAWAFDCLAAIVIAFPSRKLWRRSFAFRLRGGAPRLNFDLHRSGGVWTWLLLLMLAVSGVSMNLEREVMRPLVALFSPLRPDPLAERPPATPGEPWSRGAILARAEREASAHGIRTPAGSVSLTRERRLYRVSFFRPGDAHADGRLGNPALDFDAHSGAFLNAALPGRGSAGDVFLQAQYPLHSGRLFGVAGRALISLLGAAVATLSVTGVILWARRRRRTQRERSRRQ